MTFLLSSQSIVASFAATICARVASLALYREGSNLSHVERLLGLVAVWIAVWLGFCTKQWWKNIYTRALQTDGGRAKGQGKSFGTAKEHDHVCNGHSQLKVDPYSPSPRTKWVQLPVMTVTVMWKTVVIYFLIVTVYMEYFFSSWISSSGQWSSVLSDPVSLPIFHECCGFACSCLSVFLLLRFTTFTAIFEIANYFVAVQPGVWIRRHLVVSLSNSALPEAAISYKLSLPFSPSDSCSLRQVAKEELPCITMKCGQNASSMIVAFLCSYLSWDDYFMAIAFLSAQRSKDPNKQVSHHRNFKYTPLKSKWLCLPSTFRLQPYSATISPNLRQRFYSAKSCPV